MKISKILIDEFLASLRRRNLSPLTIDRHEYSLRYFRKWLRARRITRENLEAFVDYYSRKSSPNSVNSAITALKLFTRFLFERKYIKKELFLYLRAVKTNPFNQVILTPGQVRDILNCPRPFDKYHKYLDRTKHDLYLWLIALTGARKSEILNLRIENIDFTNNMIRIFGKGRIIRTVPLQMGLRQKLWTWFNERNVKPDDWVFQSRTETRCGSQTLTDDLKKRVKILGLDPRISLHTFRRTWITEAVRADMNPVKIMKVVGHTNFQTFLKYTKLVGEDLIETIEDHPLSKIHPENPLDPPKSIDLPAMGKNLNQIN